MTQNSGNILLGIIMVALGLVFLLDFNLVDFLGKLWPLILIAFGLYFIIGPGRRTGDKQVFIGGRTYESGIPGLAGDIKVSGLGNGIGIIEKKLLFGDIVIDISDSKLLDGENTIDVSILFGDITIIIRNDFPVKVDLAACIGNLDYRNKHSEGFFPNLKGADENFMNAQARLFIKGRLCFGDIKILISSK